MAALSIAERAWVARVAAGDVRRRGVARVLGSPLLRWRYGAPIAEALTLVPQTLRLTDPSFAAEIAGGSFGLAGVQATTGGFSPFEIDAPSPGWARELYGFGWLRHLEADGSQAAASKARSLVADWIGREGSLPEIAGEPAVVGRRIISWLNAATILLDNVDRAEFDRCAQSLVRQLKHLSAAWGCAPDGYQRLSALTGVVYGDLCIAGHERYLAASELRLAAEVERQILPDGGHASRNTQVLVELLLDLVPLRHCYLALKRPIPAGIDGGITRMMAMLRYMRLGDGALARFNGTGAPPIAEMGAVLAYDPQQVRVLPAADQSRYVRLESGGLVLIADVGAPPALEVAAAAHAGCLSFELSAGDCAIFVNGGRPQEADRMALAAARATSAHNTAVVGDKSSAKLVRHDQLERLAGDMPLRFSGGVSSSVDRTVDAVSLTAAHEGYVAEFGLVHSREIAVAADGAWIGGLDRLGGPRGALRLARDVPFAIHFHLDWQAECAIDAGGLVVIELADGSRWSFAAQGAELSVEPSIHYADPAGTVRSRQIVLRGACFGESEISWRLARSG
jgi:uncharacterized heparinase superfamily protein